MKPDSGLRFLVARNDLRRTRLAPDADAPAARVLADGEVRLAIDHFALTSNNITYAAFGEAMKYWRFFPTGDTEWGCIPVWGFAVVSESRAAGVDVGRRVYGYMPMGSHLVVRPQRVTARSCIDASAHRQDLPPTYNQLVFCDGDADYRAEHEAQQAILKPLFVTSFLIDDFLAEQHFFGARQVLLSSASSKTAYGTAHCLALRRGQADAPQVIGLTSAANRPFVASLGCYDQVLSYEELPQLDRSTRSVYVDFAGQAALRRSIHEHFDERLAYSCSVGGTHWQGLGSGAGLPGPRPTLFFAPEQLQKRGAASPQGWGAEGLQRQIGEAWRSFLEPVCSAAAPWLRVVNGRGGDAVLAAYQALIEGRADAREGQMLSLH